MVAPLWPQAVQRPGKKSEAEAVLFVNKAGTEQLRKRVRQMLRHQLSHEQFEQLSKAMTRLKTPGSQATSTHSWRMLTHLRTDN
jgi:hypothetical protein